MICFRFIDGHDQNTNIDLGKIGLIALNQKYTMKRTESNFRWTENDNLLDEKVVLQSFDYFTDTNLNLFSPKDKVLS